MHHKSKRMRVRALGIGALISTIASVGAVTDTASAAKALPTAEDTTTIELVVKTPPVVMSLRSGVRW